MPQAIRVYGTLYTPEELLKIAVTDMEFYWQSGGGITCSGGEPMMQADFLYSFLKLCKEAGLHTAVDTSGYASWQSFIKIIPVTDIFLYDIKHLDPQAHYKLTGADNKLIIENLQKLSDYGIPVEIRIPVIPKINDSDDHIKKIIELLKKLETITLIRPLPYHALSGSKYASIGKSGENRMPPSTGLEHEAAGHVRKILKDNGFPVGEA